MIQLLKNIFKKRPTCDPQWLQIRARLDDEEYTYDFVEKTFKLESDGTPPNRLTWSPGVKVEAKIKENIECALEVFKTEFKEVLNRNIMITFMATSFRRTGVSSVRNEFIADYSRRRNLI